MGNRRMFSKEVLEGDSFLDLNIEAQLLYIYLCMSADDDGFVGNPRTVSRMCDCNLDFKQGLIDSGYIIEFPSGVMVVSHWKIHNLIRKDRYKATRYIKEKRELSLNNMEIYVPFDEKLGHVDDMKNTWQPNDNQMETNCPPKSSQSNLSQDNKSKDNPSQSNQMSGTEISGDSLMDIIRNNVLHRDFNNKDIEMINKIRSQYDIEEIEDAVIRTISNGGKTVNYIARILNNDKSGISPY